MEYVMRKIMNIDRDAEIYRKGIDDLLREKQRELQRTIQDMQLDWQEEAKRIRDEVFMSKLEEAQERAGNIRAEKERQLAGIRAKYESSRMEIIEEIFNKIINSL